MRVLVPPFILQQYEDGERTGELRAVALNIDLSGFTAMTEGLVAKGDEGAETLSRIINKLFGVLIEEVEKSGGFVSTFGGDAFTAIFPDRQVADVGACAVNMQRSLNRDHIQKTAAGEFAIDARIGIGRGVVQWGILSSGTRSSYYFRGGAIEEAVAAQQHAAAGEILCGSAACKEAGGSLRLSDGDDGFARIKGVDESSEKKRSPDAESSPSPQNELTAARLHKEFVPLEELPSGRSGEFRRVASVFVSLGTPRNHGVIEELVEPVLRLSGEYGGYFNLLEFGDKGAVILLLFGAPTALGEDVRRAGEFALAVRNELGNLARIGVAEGTVFAGYVGGSGRSTYTALGSTVNLSARLSQEDRPEPVLTAGQAHDTLEEDFSLKKLYETRLKGFADITGVYAVTKARRHAPPQPPYVGRGEVLERIRGVIRKGISEESSPHYLLGEAGIGKSRVLRETFQENMEAVEVLYVEVDTILRKSMNALPSVVRHAFGLADVDPGNNPGAAAMEELVRWLGEQGVTKSSLEEVRETGSGLMALLGAVSGDSLYARLDPQGRFELTSRGLIALMGALTEIQAYTIVVDNAHALDADTRSILARVSATLADRPLVLLFSGRGEAGGEPFGIEESVRPENVTLLQGLAPEELTDLISHIISGPVDQSMTDFVIQRVGTNPFYVTELSRYLLERQLLSRGTEGYTVVATEVALPAEISGLLVARVDTLRRGVREAAKAAAVLGSEFDPQVLQGLLGDDMDVDPLLEEGVEAGLWRKTAEGTYRFEQNLLRDALEEMQLSGTRQELHARAARILEQLHHGDPTVHADLSYHYSQGGMDREARRELRLAANQAMENFKNEKALEFLTQLGEMSSSFTERIAAQRDLSSIFELTGRWREAIDTLLYALGLSFVTRDLGVRARLLADLGEVYRKQSQNKTAITILDQARSLAVRLEERSLYAESTVYLGRSYWALGDFETALAKLDDALSQSKAVDDLKLEALALYYLGTVYRDQSRYKEANANFERSYELFDRLGERRLATYPLYDLGTIRLQQGALEEAKSLFEQVLSTYTEIGYLSGASAATLNLGVLRDRRGDFNGALRYYQEAREIAESINEKLAMAYTLFSIGATYYKIGDDRKSLSYLKDSLRLMKQLGARGYYGYALSYLVSLLARSGNVEGAIKLAQEHQHVVDKVGTDPENGRAILGLAVALAKKPNLSSEARERLNFIAKAHELDEASPDSFYREAIAISEPTQYVDTLIPSHFHYAKYLKTKGDEEGFRRHLKTAFELAVEAQWDRFVLVTKKNHEAVLRDLGVDTEVETDGIEGLSA